MSTALYRHYSAGGDLLYVGISKNALYRTAEHAEGSRWFSFVSRIDIEHYPSREAALSAERDAIRNEHPLFNVRDAASLGPFAVANFHHPEPYADGWYRNAVDAIEALFGLRQDYPEREWRVVKWVEPEAFVARILILCEDGFARWQRLNGLNGELASLRKPIPRNDPNFLVTLPVCMKAI